MTEKTHFDALEGAQSIARAKGGDISIILERLRSDSHLLDVERHFLADLIERKWKLPARRPEKLATEIRNREMIQEFLIRRVFKTGPKVAEAVAYSFGLTVSQLHQVHREFRRDERAYELLCEKVAESVNLVLMIAGVVDKARREEIQRRWSERQNRRRARQSALVDRLSI